jgi:hypothetical protein
MSFSELSSRCCFFVAPWRSQTQSQTQTEIKCPFWDQMNSRLKALFAVALSFTKAIGRLQQKQPVIEGGNLSPKSLPFDLPS